MYYVIQGYIFVHLNMKCDVKNLKNIELSAERQLGHLTGNRTHDLRGDRR
jgi:hypothetical protein